MHKRLWIIVAVIASAVVLAVVLGTLFSIGGVDVNTTNDITLSAEQKSDIISLSEIKKGKNIFSVDEAIASDNIELNHPALKVISIERKFPNKVVIYVTGRTGVFSFRMENGQYAVLDRELKVISISGNRNSSLTELTGLPDESIKLGQIVDYRNGLLLKMVKGAERCSFINARFSAFFTKAEIKEDTIDLTTNSGVIMQLPVSSNIDESVIGCYNYYLNKTSPLGKSSGYIRLKDNGWKWEPVE
ncbi:MAG: FtsQ-type POTRA domain-containing protein [Clostridia bacterium]|nr:FtsQ-type POTRA domain-containing protein [Clostridia bacterium]